MSHELQFLTYSFEKNVSGTFSRGIEVAFGISTPMIQVPTGKVPSINRGVPN